jgi:hypothetical protein
MVSLRGVEFLEELHAGVMVRGVRIRQAASIGEIHGYPFIVEPHDVVDGLKGLDDRVDLRLR